MSFYNKCKNPIPHNWMKLYLEATPHEVEFEKWVAKLGRPYRFQHPMLGNLIVDFCLIEDKVIIELDGDSHTRAYQKKKDKERTARLNKYGWTVVRAWNADVRRRPVETLNKLMEQAGLPYRLEEDIKV